MASSPDVVVLGELPAVDGMTGVTEKVVTMLEEQGRLAALLVGARGGSTWALVRRIRRMVLLLAQLPRLVPQRIAGAKVLYLPTDDGAGLVRMLITVVVGRACRYRIVLHHHSFTYVDQRDPLMAALTAVGGTGLDHVLLCERMRADFCRLYRPRGRTVVVSNVAFMVPAGSVESPPAESTGMVRRIGIFGNLTIDKGLLVFLDLAARHAADDRVCFHAGGRVDPSLMPLVDAAVSQGDLVFHGPLHGQEREEFLSALALLVFPTTYVAEAEPLVIWEATSVGVPVVSYHRGCIAAQLPAQNVVADETSLVAWVERFLEDETAARAAARQLRDEIPSRAVAARERLVDLLAA